MNARPVHDHAPGRPRWLGTALVLPALVVGVLVIAYPVLRTFGLSVTDATMRTLHGEGRFVGLSNFVRAVCDPGFRRALAITTLFAVASAAGSIAAGLAVALLLTRPIRGRALWRAICLFPYAAPVAASAFAWQWLLEYDYGAVNALLAGAGAGRVAWFTTPGLDLAVCVAFQTWRYFPFAMLLLLARLRSIPPALYEAAAVDGAGLWSTFRHITWPQVSSLCALLFALRMLWSFNRFDDVFLLTGGRGWTHVVTIDLYETAFTGRQEFGLAAAMAILVLATFLVLVALLQGGRKWAGPRV